MAFCTYCGQRISDLAVECPKCGTATPVSPAPAAGGPMFQRAFPNAPQLRPLGIGEIIDAAIKIYRANAGSLLKAVAVVVVPVQIIGALIQTSVVPDQPSALEQTQLQPGVTPVPTFDASDFWALAAGLVLTAMLNFLAAQLATAASLRAVSEGYLGERSDWRQSLDFAFRRLGPLVWVAILSAIAVGLGFLFCIIPGIWLSVAFSVAVPALLFEGERGTTALRRSFNLVKGRWWPVFGATILGQIIAAIVGFVFGAAFGALSFAGDSAFVSFITTALGSAASQTLVTPFLAAMIAIIYFDLRVRKEGFDLELLAQQVGGDVEQSPWVRPASSGPAPGTPVPGTPFATPSRTTGPQESRSLATERAPTPRPRKPRPPRSREPVVADEEMEAPSAEPPAPDAPKRPPPRRRPTRPGYEPNAADGDAGRDEPSDR